jgi:hypothetical protein
MPDDAPVTSAIGIVSLFVFMGFLGEDSEAGTLEGRNVA